MLVAVGCCIDKKGYNRKQAMYFNMCYLIERRNNQVIFLKKRKLKNAERLKLVTYRCDSDTQALDWKILEW